jgi:hypothetical protein
MIDDLEDTGQLGLTSDLSGESLEEPWGWSDCCCGDVATVPAAQPDVYDDPVPTVEDGLPSYAEEAPGTGATAWVGTDASSASGPAVELPAPAPTDWTTVGPQPATVPDRFPTTLSGLIDQATLGSAPPVPTSYERFLQQVTTGDGTYNGVALLPAGTTALAPVVLGPTADPYSVQRGFSQLHQTLTSLGNTTSPLFTSGAQYNTHSPFYRPI